MAKYEVRLVQAPFLGYYIPSLPLTMLNGVIGRKLGDAVDARVVYANFDVAKHIGLDFYEEICLSGNYFYSGFGEWLFRQAAFPDLSDNTDEYFARFYPTRCDHTEQFRAFVRAKRAGLDAVLDGIVGKYGLDKADLVGFNSTFQENLFSFALARRIKRRNPAVVTIMGGSNCESPAGEEIVRHIDAIDYVFSGPGLLTLSRFIEARLAGDVAACDRIDGVFSKQNCGIRVPGDPSTRFRDVGPIGEDLDIDYDYPLDYDSYFADLEREFPDQQITSVVPFQTSRGCWWGEKSHCTFCGLNGKTMAYRMMSPEVALKTIKSLYKYRDKAQVLLWTDSIMHPSYVSDVFPALDAPEDMILYNQVKVPLRDGDIKAMADARVLYTTPGFESFSTSTLKLMAKGATAFQNIKVIKLCTLHGVHPLWGLLLGSPGEEAEAYAKYADDLPRFVHFPPPIGAFSVKFHRYSPYWKTPEKWGLKLEPDDYYALTYPFDEPTLRNIAYEFQDVGLSSYKVALARWFDKIKEPIDAWKARWRDGRPKPALHLTRRGDQAVVFDSRSGEIIERPISDVTREVLLSLEQHKRRTALAAEFAHVPGFDVERELATLRSWGLLFEEDDRAISLVLPEKPAQMLTWEYSYIQGRRVKREPRSASPAEGPLTSFALGDVSTAAPQDRVANVMGDLIESVSSDNQPRSRERKSLTIVDI